MSLYLKALLASCLPHPPPPPHPPTSLAWVLCLPSASSLKISVTQSETLYAALVAARVMRCNPNKLVGESFFLFLSWLTLEVPVAETHPCIHVSRKSLRTVASKYE